MRVRINPLVTPEGQPYRAPEPSHRTPEGPRPLGGKSVATLAQFQGRVLPELHDAVSQKAGHAYHA